MKFKNIFLLISAAVLSAALAVFASAQGSVNSNNENVPSTYNGFEDTTGVFDTDGVSSDIPDPATEFNESDEVTAAPATDTDTEERLTAVDPATNTAAADPARTRSRGR